MATWISKNIKNTNTNINKNHMTRARMLAKLPIFYDKFYIKNYFSQASYV